MDTERRDGSEELTGLPEGYSEPLSRPRNLVLRELRIDPYDW